MSTRTAKREGGEQAREKQQRTCIACGARGRKEGLKRIVRKSDGSVEFDEGGKAAGRGAYVCSVECLGKARKSRGLERALKMKVADEDYERIADQMRRAL